MPLADDEVARSRARRLLRRIAVDVSPLRASRDFRRLWFGWLASHFGYHFTVVATFVQVYRLTGSSAAVGAIGLVGLLGIVVGVLGGGAFIDAFDRRRILIWAQGGFIAATATLFVATLLGSPPLALIYVASGTIAGLSSINSSVLNAMTPTLVGAELLPSALTLNQVQFQSTGLVGPALAGIAIETVGLEIAYAIDLLCCIGMLLAVLGTSRALPRGDVDAIRGFAAIREGFSFVRGRRVIQAAFGMDLVAMIFGMPRALFPVLAVSRFGGGAGVVGLLFSAPAVGALLAGLTGGWMKHVRRQGVAVALAVVVWGVGITLFGLAGSNLVLAVVCLAIAGGADVVSAVFRHTILQLSTPDHLRGRLSGINHLVVAGGPRLGDLEAGLVAAAFSPHVSVVSGGLACIGAAAILSALVPALRRYESPTAPLPEDAASGY
jgi:MFS family permease